MATPDPVLVAALAEHIRLHRETYFHDPEAVAEAEGIDLADLLDAVGWYRQVAEPRYRGTAVLAAASAMATGLRHGRRVKPATEINGYGGAEGENHKDARPGALDCDKPDPSRPERPCARCGNRFQPTLRRRMLCLHCFGDEERGNSRDYLTRRDVANVERYGAPGESW